MVTTHKLIIPPRFADRSRALVVDGHATTRNILASQLRELGVGQIVQCARPWEAVQQIEQRGFDVVLCEQRLADGTLGQDLIDDLRRRSQLSLRTVVIMISGDASYNVVAEVAEAAVDGFIVKPYSPGALEVRLMRAFIRKKALQDVFDAIEAQEHAKALKLCEDRFRSRAPHWSYAARLGAELALRLDRAALASTLYEAVLAVKTVPWAKLGIARALDAGGARAEAVSTIEGLLATEPSYVDAYDVLGKIHAEQGNLAAALTAYKQATDITPASVTRAQRYGIVAYYAGDAEQALAALERAATLGANSSQFDHQTLLLLALTRYRRGDKEGLQRCRTQLDLALGVGGNAAAPGATLLTDADLATGAARAQRLTRFGQVVQALDDTLQGRGGAALAQVSALADDLLVPDFDIEAAANLLSLLAELESAGIVAPQCAQWLRSAGLRFCVSRHATDVLVKACEVHATYATALRAAHAEIGDIAQQALSEALIGNHRQAVKQLLDQVQLTRNLKLLQTATASLTRHRDRIGDAPELHARCAELQQLCGVARRAPLLPEEGERPAGGLALGPIRATA